MSEVRYMISDAADKLGMEAHVLRYWEEELELEIPRNEMGHRYYTEEWLGTFTQICELKKRGYQLRAIKMLLHNQNQYETEWLMHPQSHEQLLPGTPDKMEQFQTLMTTIVRNALAENNQALGQAVSKQVGDQVLKEMNYLMREREEQEEARFRKLDETLRMRQTHLRSKKERGFFKRTAKRKEENGQDSGQEKKPSPA